MNRDKSESGQDGEQGDSGRLERERSTITGANTGAEGHGDEGKQRRPVEDKTTGAGSGTVSSRP
jgi:hypothetical protein